MSDTLFDRILRHQRAERFRRTIHGAPYPRTLEQAIREGYSPPWIPRWIPNKRWLKRGTKVLLSDFSGDTYLKPSVLKFRQRYGVPPYGPMFLQRNLRKGYCGYNRPMRKYAVNQNPANTYIVNRRKYRG